MTRLTAGLALLLTGLAATAAAADGYTLTYATFEAAVPHVDLETCPASLAAPDRFCRATVHHEEIHVFAFTTEGESPLQDFASWPADGAITLPE